MPEPAQAPPAASPDAPRRVPAYVPFFSLVRARVFEFWREPAAIFWVYVFPLILVVALGAAFRNRPVDRFNVVIQQNAGAAWIQRVLGQDERFRGEVCEAGEAARKLRTGRADALIVGDPAAEDVYEFRYDPTREASLLARTAADDVLQRAAGRRDVLDVRDRPLSEPGGRYIDFLIPGLLGLGLLGGGLWGVGFAIVDLRIRKLLKRYLATPMRRSHFLGAVMASRLLFTIPEVLLVLLFARLLFGVTSEGSYTALGVLVLLGAFEFSGVGLLVASRAQTIETISGLMNAVMLPMWIGSGIFFSIERFPPAVQPWLSALPLTPLIHAMRSVMLEGAGLAELTPSIAAIVAWGGISFWLALRWFRWN